MIAIVLALLLPLDSADLKPLQGSWKPTEGTVAGAKMEEPFLKSLLLQINGDAYTLTSSGPADKGTLTADSKTKPASMTITGVEGPNRGKTYYSIYELKDETLKICYSLDEKNKPTEFTSTGQNKQILIVYKKQK